MRSRLCLEGLCGRRRPSQHQLKYTVSMKEEYYIFIYKRTSGYMAEEKNCPREITQVRL